MSSFLSGFKWFLNDTLEGRTFSTKKELVQLFGSHSEKISFNLCLSSFFSFSLSISVFSFYLLLFRCIKSNGSADGNFEVTLATKAILNSKGMIQWKPPAIYKSSCGIDVRYFPFDEQTCIMKFGSWTYDGFKVCIIRTFSELSSTIWRKENKRRDISSDTLSNCGIRDWRKEVAVMFLSSSPGCCFFLQTWSSWQFVGSSSLSLSLFLVPRVWLVVLMGKIWVVLVLNT